MAEARPRAERMSGRYGTKISTTLPPPARPSVPAAKMPVAEERDGRVSSRRLGGRAGALARAVPGAAATQGAAALGAGLPQGPDPAGRAEERRADGGAGRARRPAAAAPLRLDLALGERVPGRGAGEGGRPAGGRP